MRLSQYAVITQHHYSSQSLKPFPLSLLILWTKRERGGTISIIILIQNTYNSIPHIFKFSYLWQQQPKNSKWKILEISNFLLYSMIKQSSSTLFCLLPKSLLYPMYPLDTFIVYPHYGCWLPISYLVATQFIRLSDILLQSVFKYENDNAHNSGIPKKSYKKLHLHAKRLVWEDSSVGKVLATKHRTWTWSPKSKEKIQAWVCVLAIPVLGRRGRRDGSVVKRALAFLSGGPNTLIPKSSHGSSQLSMTLLSRGWETLFWPPQAPGMHMVHRHTWL